LAQEFCKTFKTEILTTKTYNYDYNNYQNRIVAEKQPPLNAAKSSCQHRESADNGDKNCQSVIQAQGIGQKLTINN
jgi:hypothetical protein